MLKILLRDLRSSGIIVAAKTKKLPSIPFLSTYSAFMIISLFNDYKDGDNMPLWDWDLIRKNHLPDKENVLCVYTYHGGFRKISPAAPQLWTKEKPSHLCHLCISHVSLITINITSSFKVLNSFNSLSDIFYNIACQQNLLEIDQTTPFLHSPSLRLFTITSVWQQLNLSGHPIIVVF